MKVMNNYYEALEYAKKHKLVECEYGDYDELVSYCAWNKTGDRDDEAELECYYIFERSKDGTHRPESKTSGWLKDWTKRNIGLGE